MIKGAVREIKNTGRVDAGAARTRMAPDGGAVPHRELADVPIVKNEEIGRIDLSFGFERKLSERELLFVQAGVESR